MAATYVEVPLEDMERFLRRGYRILHPKKGVSHGQIYYDLDISDGEIFIRVMTGIRPQGGIRGVGEDSIKVVMVANDRGLMKTQKIVKRTKNWKTSLQDRIEEMLEIYEAKPEYWKSRAQGGRAPSPERAVPPSEAPPPETRLADPHEGQFTKYRGEWSAKIFGRAEAGDRAILVSQKGSRAPVTLGSRLWKGQDRFGNRGYIEIWTFERADGRRYASGQGPDDEPVDGISDRVAQRYMNVVR